MSAGFSFQSIARRSSGSDNTPLMRHESTLQFTGLCGMGICEY
jgi:hypothetical protein